MLPKENGEKPKLGISVTRFYLSSIYKINLYVYMYFRDVVHLDE